MSRSTQQLRDQCELTTEKAFVVYSASGSFFVPLLIMMIVYLKIFMAARRRIRLVFRFLCCLITFKFLEQIEAEVPWSELHNSSQKKNGDPTQKG